LTAIAGLAYGRILRMLVAQIEYCDNVVLGVSEP
jgi:hypothetical protein